MQFSSLIFISTLLVSQKVEAGFSNSGIMKSKSINLSVGCNLENDGGLFGAESVNLCCDTFSGKGLVKSPQIVIKTNNFNFTGEINCSGKCMIIATTYFDDQMFKRSGDGEFVIVFHENLFEEIN